jgi:hypothetical protein
MRFTLRSAWERLHVAGTRHTCKGIDTREAFKHVIGRVLYAGVWDMETPDCF